MWFLAQSCPSAKTQPLLRHRASRAHVSAGDSSEVQAGASLPFTHTESSLGGHRSLVGHGPSPSSSTPGAEQREKQYRAHQGSGDHHGGVTGAHTYFYADEVKCDQHMETFLHCIDASSECSMCPGQPHCAGDCQDPSVPPPYPSCLRADCQADSVLVAPSRWQLRGWLLCHQADSAGQTPVPGECQSCDRVWWGRARATDDASARSGARWHL